MATPKLLCPQRCTAIYCPQLYYDLHLCHGSASVERVFSMVNDMFGDDQKSVLADQIQAGVMLRYNKRVIG